MSTALQRALGALAAVTMLAACSGGGSAPATSTIPGQTTAVAPKATPPPAASARTPRGSGTLTIKLPKALVATRAGNAAARRPSYVNPVPIPQPSGSPALNNLLDIYVDGTLIPNLDGLTGSSDSAQIQDVDGDGTQTLTVPLFSTTSTVVAVEWDPPKQSVLAIGDTNVSGFSPGSSNSLALTMQMNAMAIGIVDILNLNNFPTTAQLSGQTYTGGNTFTCPSLPSSNAFALYPTDAEGVLVPVAGYGGTSTATVSTFASDNGGSTHIAQSVAGTYFVAFDNGCNGVTVAASAPNPAYALYLDVTNTNFWAYVNAFNGSYNAVIYNSSAVNQGIFNLWYEFGLLNIYQFQNSTVSGTIDIKPALL